MWSKQNILLSSLSQVIEIPLSKIYADFPYSKKREPFPCDIHITNVSFKETTFV